MHRIGVIHIEVSAKERVLLLHAFANSVILCVRMSSSLKRVDLRTMKWCLYYGSAGEEGSYPFQGVDASVGQTEHA